MATLSNDIQAKGSALTTEILNLTDLKGEERTNAGITIEKALKAFAAAILDQAKKDSALQ